MRISGHTASAIARSVEQQLRSPGAMGQTRLPSVREAAQKLQVSPATVAAAYKLLQGRGLIAGEGRRGTRVIAARFQPTVSASAVPTANGIVDLASGNPDPALLPSLESALRSVRPEHTLYGGSLEGPLMTFAAGEFEADGIPAAHLAVLSGALDTIDRIFREYLRAGDRVAVEDPSFPGIFDLLAASAFLPTPFAVDAQGPVPDAVARALARGCRAIIVTPRAQNPTGAAITPDRAAELRRILRRVSDILLIENDYCAPIAGVPAVSLVGGFPGPWAVIRSTSKFLGPDLRVAVMAGDDLTVGRVRGRQAVGMRWVSSLLQQVALALWSDPAGGRHLARVAEIYAQRRRALQTALAARGLTVAGSSGFHLWIPVYDESAAVRALAARGWAVAPGERFRLKTASAIRVTTAALLPSDSGRVAQDVAEARGPSRTVSA